MHNDEIDNYPDEEERREKIDKILTGILRYITNWGWLTVIVIYLIVSNWFCLIRSSGESMEPTITEGQFFICDRTQDNFNYDDIVVIQTDEKYLYFFKMKIIKRIVGLPGDTLEVIDGYIYVNGVKEDRDFPAIEDAGILSEPLTLGEDMYFCVGDNRNNSGDSRIYGAFRKDQIFGTIKPKGE